MGEGRGKDGQQPTDKVRGGRGGQGWDRNLGDRKKLETFQSHVHWTDLRTPEATLAAPIGKKENPEINMIKIFCICEKMQGNCDPGARGIGCVAADAVP